MGDGSGGAVLVNAAKVVLLLVNMAFMVGGAMLVYFSHKVKSSGWLDAFQGDYAWVGKSTFLMTLILGAVVIALAALGCFGALLRQKLLLTIYAGVLVITLGFFVVVAIGAHSVNSKATAWGATDFPAVPSETSIGENFNQLYCAAQVPYYCVDAGVNDVLTMFNQSLPGAFSTATKNFSSFCGVMNVPQVETVCKVCSLVAKYSEYTAVLNWAQEKCPRTAKNQVWCGAFLLSGGNVTSQGSAVANNAPYGQCRPLFFELITKWSSFLMGCSIGVCAATVAVLALTLVLRCHRPSDDSDEKDVRYSAAYAQSNQQYATRIAQPQYGHATQHQAQYSGYDNQQQQQQYGNDHLSGYHQQEQQQQYGDYGHQQQQQYRHNANQRYVVALSI